jgi:hypothetical protein
MKIPLRMQRILWRFNVYLPKAFTESYMRNRVTASPSLQALGTNISSKVARFQIMLTVRLKRILLVYVVIYAAFAAVVITVRHTHQHSLFYIIYITGSILIYAIFLGLFWRLYRSSQENYAVVRLFFTICFLEENASKWPGSKFRWHVAHRLEGVARSIEQIPLASKSLTPRVKQEAFRLSRSKAHAVRKLELWAIRPMAFTFTDLVQQLTTYLSLLAENRWYDLPEEEVLETEHPRWLYVLQIGGAIVVIGGAITLTAFAAKVGPVAPVLTLILFALAIALLNSAGISTGVIDRYVQTGSKVMSGK